MFIYTLKFDRKKAAFAVVIAALLIIGIILMIGAHNKKAAAENPGQTQTNSVSAKNERGRVAYLARYGWEVETPALSEAKVVIPRTFSAVFEEYNALQKEQGFDLSRYCGTEVTMYSYRVTNEIYAGDEVLAVLYIQNGEVVGGDVHSTALDGFMVGVVK